MHIFRLKTYSHISDHILNIIAGVKRYFTLTCLSFAALCSLMETSRTFEIDTYSYVILWRMTWTMLSKIHTGDNSNILILKIPFCSSDFLLPTCYSYLCSTVTLKIWLLQLHWGTLQFSLIVLNCLTQLLSSCSSFVRSVCFR